MTKSQATGVLNAQTLGRQFGKILIKPGDGFYAFKVVPDAEMFVGGVDGITVQTKTHKDGLAFQLLFK